MGLTLALPRIEDNTMELAQALAQMPIERVAEIADHWGIDVAPHSKRSLVEGVAAHFRSPQSLKEAVQRLGSDELEVLRCCLHLGPGAADLDDLIGAFHPVDSRGTPLNLPVTVERLMTRGFLIPEGDFARTERFFMPSDLRRSLAAHLLSRQERLLVAPRGEPDQVLARPGEFLEDLFGFVCAVQREPTRLTGDGFLFKRSIERVLRRLRVPVDDGLAGMPVELPGFPGRLDFIQGFALAAKLVRRLDSELRMGPAWEEWLDRSRTAMLAEAFRYFEGRHVKRDFQLRGILSYLVSHADSDEWVPIDRSLEEVFGFGEEDSALFHGTRRKAYYLMHMLMNLGLLDLAYFQAERVIASRPTPPAAEVFANKVRANPSVGSSNITIQPNFEILVAPDAPFRLRWQLERMADLLSQDVVLTYRISKESLYAGMRSGIRWEDIETLLRKHLARPCPQNVRHNLESWWGRYGEVSFMEGLLMRCRSEALAEEISHLPDVAPHIRGRISAKDLLVDAGHYDEVLQTLQQHGYMPEPKENS